MGGWISGWIGALNWMSVVFLRLRKWTVAGLRVALTLGNPHKGVPLQPNEGSRTEGGVLGRGVKNQTPTDKPDTENKSPKP